MIVVNISVILKLLSCLHHSFFQERRHIDVVNGVSDSSRMIDVVCCTVVHYIHTE